MKIPKRDNQIGFSLVELMVAVSVLGILSLGVLHGFGTAARIIKGSDRASVQSQLALAKLEEIAGTSATTLAAGEQREPGIQERGMTFERITRIVAFADGRKQVTVTVSVTTPGVTQPPVVYESIFNPWGLR